MNSDYSWSHYVHGQTQLLNQLELLREVTESQYPENIFI